MPAAVIEDALEVSDEEVDIIRATLDRLDENGRRTLWQVLDTVDRVIGNGGGPGRVANVVALAPVDIRAAVAQVAMARWRRSSPTSSPANSAGMELTGRPEFYGFAGRAADHDTWTNTWSWSSFSPDCLAQARATRPIVPLCYRHQTGEPLGITKHWALSDDGDLDVEASFFPTRRAQLAAKFARQGDLRGLSLGVRATRSSWSFVSPAEWEPRTLSLDLGRFDLVEICELSLTPSARQPAAKVRAVW